MRRAPFLVLALATLVPGCGGARTESVTVYAAASARDALERIAADYHAATGVHIEIQPGASSTLARQIAEGGPADLFLSADDPWADFLAGRGLVAQRRDLLGNQLVVAVPADRVLEIHDLKELAGPQVEHLALAGPAVPAGRYARQALERAGVWDRLKDRVREGGDVRATLTYVARGEADAGIVYATDVRGNDRVRVALAVDQALHEPIRYPLVLVRREPLSDEARKLYDYLCGDEAARRFREAGFTVPARVGR